MLLLKKRKVGLKDYILSANMVLIIENGGELKIFIELFFRAARAILKMCRVMILKKMSCFKGEHVCVDSFEVFLMLMQQLSSLIRTPELDLSSDTLRLNLSLQTVTNVRKISSGKRSKPDSSFYRKTNYHRKTIRTRYWQNIGKTFRHARKYV